MQTSGEVGYLPQDPRIGDPEVLARDRILSARGLDDVVRRLRAAEAMGSDDPQVRDRAMKRYTRADADLHAGGGYAASPRAADRQQPGHRRADPRPAAQDPLRRPAPPRRARPHPLLRAPTRCCSTSRNHLDADSIVWLREFLKAHKGGLIVISHDNALLEPSTRCSTSTPTGARSTSTTWAGRRTCRSARPTSAAASERRTPSKAKTLTDQANKMRAKASKATAAQSMLKRAEKMMAGLEGERQADKVARIKFPAPAPSGKTPLTAQELSKSYGPRGLHRRRPGDRQGQPRRHPRPQRGQDKTTMLRILAGVDQPDTGQVVPGYGLKLGYYAQEHETLDTSHRAREHAERGAAADRQRGAQRPQGRSCSPGTTPTSRPRCCRVGRPGWPGQPGVSSANVLLLDEPTNNLDPASRGGAGGDPDLRGRDHPRHPRRRRGPRARARPVLLLPDGDEDLWNDDYADLVAGLTPRLRSHDPRVPRRRRPAPPAGRAGRLDHAEPSRVRNAQTPAMWRALAELGTSLPEETRVVVVRGPA